MHCVEVYHADVRDWNIEELKGVLLDEEISQFSKIKHVPTLHSKVVSRALLRCVLSGRCGIGSREVAFDYGAMGKPKLRNDPHLHFNTSHSHHLVLIGISYGHLIGVDIEEIKSLEEEDCIAKNFFHEAEYAVYKKRRQLYSHAFHEFWTAKEGIIKALGRGLGEAKYMPMIVQRGGELRFRPAHHLDQKWTLAFLPVHPAYISCVVVNAPELDIKSYHLSPDMPPKFWSKENAKNLILNGN